MGEQGLRRQAGCERVGVDLGVFFPRARVFELEHPRPDVRDQHALLELLGGGQPLRLDVLQASQVARKRMGLGVDRRPAEILEEIVVNVNAVECRVGRVRLVEKPEQSIDEVRKRFGSGHGQPLMVQ